MSILTQAANDELDAQLLAMTNVIDGLSLVISRQQAVMRQALEALETGWDHRYTGKDARSMGVQAITALRNSLEGKQ